MTATEDQKTAALAGKLLAVFVLIIPVGVAVVVTFFVLRPGANGAPEKTDTFYLGDEIYQYDGTRFYFHGSTADYVLIGHYSGHGYGGSMSNMYIPLDQGTFTLRNRAFTVEELGPDYIRLTW